MLLIPLRKNMKRIKVESSNIESIGYSDSDLILEVEFTCGSIYKYHPVSRYKYKGLMDAKSKGQYFAQHIRGNKRINCEQVL